VSEKEIIFHECCRCGEMKICDEYNWNMWCQECFIIAQLTRDERSILLYLEACLVDQLGRAEGQRMNEDDFKAIEILKKKGLIKGFGRIKYRAVQKLRYGPSAKVYTNWVRLTDKGWKVVHQLRKERSDRMIEKDKKSLEAEMTKNR